MNPLNTNTVLLLVGLVVLLINIIIGVVRLRQGKAHAGLVSVVLALAACAIITFAVVKITFASPSPASDPAATVTANQSAKTAGAQIVPVSDAVNTTRAQSGANGINPQVLAPIAAPRIAVVGGLVILILGIVLFMAERRREEFNPSNSAGLLNAGAGIFVMTAALVIPMLPSQFSGGTRVNAAGTPTVARIVETPTPTQTFTALPSATPMPSLTPAPSDTPVTLVTAIAYVSTSSSTATACTLTTNTLAYLRGDPSTKKASIGSIFPGSLLQVTGQSTDEKWWRVIYTDNGTSLEGWVAAQYVTPDAACGDGSVQLVGPTATPTRTARPSATLMPTISTSSSTSTTVASQGASQGSCTLITIAAVSLRPDPSLKQPPVAQLPEHTALVATEKTANGWYHVQASPDGWIGAGAVFAESTCATIPVVAAP